MIRFFHTNITVGQYRPIGISGSVHFARFAGPGINASFGVPFFPEGAEFEDVKGVKLDVAFLENNYRDCESLKGYQYMGV